MLLGVSCVVCLGIFCWVVVVLVIAGLCVCMGVLVLVVVFSVYLVVSGLIVVVK